MRGILENGPRESILDWLSKGRRPMDLVEIGSVRPRAGWREVTERVTMCCWSHCLERKQPPWKSQDQQVDETPITDKPKRRNTFKNHLLAIESPHLQVASYLIKSHHKIFQGIVFSVLGVKNWCWDGRFEAGQGCLAFWRAQVPGQEAKVVNWQDPSVNVLLLLHQDAGDFLWELNEGLQINQLLADPSWTWREGTRIGHGGAWLTFWNKEMKVVVTPRLISLQQMFTWEPLKILQVS